MKKRSVHVSRIVLWILILVFTVVIVSNAVLIFRMTSTQTDNLGTKNLESISNELQGMLSTAQYMTSSLSAKTEELLEAGTGIEDLRSFFNQQCELQKRLSNGMCINTCCVYQKEMIVPGWVQSDDFVLEDRLWYRSARQLPPGGIYISPPYLDVVTGDMCFTVVQLLSDGETTVSLDFVLTNIQEYIRKMEGSMEGEALIVGSEGLIVGNSKGNLVGQSLRDVLPEYEGVFHQISTSESISTEEKIQGKTRKIFAKRTFNDWYLIVSLNSMELYKDSYFSLLRNSILGFALVVGIIVFYEISRKKQKYADQALSVKEEFLGNMSAELRDPIQKILLEAEKGAKTVGDNHKQTLSDIRQAALQLSSMMDNLFSYSDLTKAENQKAEEKKTSAKLQDYHAGKVFQRSLLIAMIFTLVITMAFTANIVITLGESRMEKEVESYRADLSEWMTGQKNILDLFAKSITANPDVLLDYDRTVRYLDDIAGQYRDIASVFLANPAFENQIIMNDGWVPDDDYIVQAYGWYVGAMECDGEIYCSAPYYDSVVGAYYVTIAEKVTSRTGEFVGVMGVDFYLDKLTQKLRQEYSEEGYAFLVNDNGTIINHPYSAYELSATNFADVRNLSYNKALSSDSAVLLKDYDGRIKSCIAVTEEASGFTCVLVKNAWVVYGALVVLELVFMALFGGCIAILGYLIRRLTNWQEEVNKRLQNSMEAAVKAGNAKTEFLANMSHEIRTPINAVLGMNEMILRECKDQKMLEYAENIQSAGRTLLSLINDILDFSKIESGKMEIVPVEYRPSNLVGDLVNVIKDRLAAKNLEFHLEIDESIPSVLRGDDVRVRQIITNLLTNAAKYTKKGSVTLQMKLVEKKENAVKLYVAVKDTGIGIKEEDRDKLFVSFQRLDVKKNRTIEGTGLGLTIVQSLLQRMESNLQVDSVYGEGSTFSFELQQEIVDAAPMGTFQIHRETGTLEGELKWEKTMSAPDAKVLVVDDTEMNLKVAKHLLKWTGVQTDTASGGRSAIEMLKEKRYDVIFLDHMMPELDGIETLHIIREEKLAEGVPFVALTANAIQGARQEYLAAGFQDYLSKPITGESIGKMLFKYLPKEKIINTAQDEKPE